MEGAVEQTKSIGLLQMQTTGPHTWNLLWEEWISLCWCLPWFFVSVWVGRFGTAFFHVEVRWHQNNSSEPGTNFFAPKTPAWNNLMWEMGVAGKTPCCKCSVCTFHCDYQQAPRFPYLPYLLVKSFALARFPGEDCMSFMDLTKHIQCDRQFATRPLRKMGKTFKVLINSLWHLGTLLTMKYYVFLPKKSRNI